MPTVSARHPQPAPKKREYHDAPVDHAKVARLREALKNREYTLSAKAIAEAMSGVICVTAR